MDSTLVFFVTVLAILAAPGPTNTLLATAGAMRGPRALVLAPAEGAGFLIAVAALGLVVGPALAAAPLAGKILRVVVGAYLVLLAYRLWRQASAPNGGKAQTVGPRQVFVATLLNPKAIVFAALVPFGRPEATLDLFGLAALSILTGGTWTLVGAAMGHAAHGREGVVPRVGSAVLAFFAGVVVYPAL